MNGLLTFISSALYAKLKTSVERERDNMGLVVEVQFEVVMVDSHTVAESVSANW